MVVATIIMRFMEYLLAENKILYVLGKGQAAAPYADPNSFFKTKYHFPLSDSRRMGGKRYQIGRRDLDR